MDIIEIKPEDLQKEYPIFQAVYNCDIVAIRDFVIQNNLTDFNFVSTVGLPIFQYSLANKNIDYLIRMQTCDFLLKKKIDGGLTENGANIDLLNTQGRTYLVERIWQRNPKEVQWLVDRGADVNLKINMTIQNKSFMIAPLHFAVKRSNPDIITTLLKAKASIDCVTEEGLTPLMLAARDGDSAVIRLLVESKASVKLRDKKGSSIIAMEILNQKTESTVLLRYLINHNYNLTSIDANKISALMAAAYSGKQEIVECILTYLPLNDIFLKDKHGIDALRWARQPWTTGECPAEIIKKKEAIYQLLLRKIAIHTCLEHVSNGNLEEVQKSFTQNGVTRLDRGTQLGTPLMVAAAYGKLEMAKFLLQEQPEEQLRLQDFKNRTALMHAIYSHKTLAVADNTQMVNLLLQAQKNTAVTELKDKVLFTALHWAVLKRDPEIVRMLITSNQDLVLSPDVDGNLPLHWACMLREIEIVKSLLSRTQSQRSAKQLTTPNKKGRLPIFYVLDNGNTSLLILECLLKYYAIEQVLHLDGNKKIPLYAVCRLYDPKSVALLLQHAPEAQQQMLHAIDPKVLERLSAEQKKESEKAVNKPNDYIEVPLDMLEDMRMLEGAELEKVSHAHHNHQSNQVVPMQIDNSQSAQSGNSVTRKRRSTDTLTDASTRIPREKKRIKTK